MTYKDETFEQNLKRFCLINGYLHGSMRNVTESPEFSIQLDSQATAYPLRSNVSYFHSNNVLVEAEQAAKELRRFYEHGRIGFFS